MELIRSYGVRHIHCSDYNRCMVDKARENITALEATLGREAVPSVTYSADNVCDMPGIKSDR